MAIPLPLVARRRLPGQGWIPWQLLTSSFFSFDFWHGREREGGKWDGEGELVLVLISFEFYPSGKLIEQGPNCLSPSKHKERKEFKYSYMSSLKHIFLALRFQYLVGPNVEAPSDHWKLQNLKPCYAIRKAWLELWMCPLQITRQRTLHVGSQDII